MHILCTPLCFTQDAPVSFLEIRGVHFLVSQITDNSSGARRNGCRFVLAFFWILGLIFGVFLFQTAGDSFLPLMRSIPQGAVSIMSLFCSVYLPFLFSAFAVICSQTIILFPISFCEAFLLSFVSFGVTQAYGTAGWLIRSMLLFSNFFCAPILYFLWLRYLSGFRRFSLLEFLFIGCAVILIGSIHYSIITPLLVRLIIL